jgi:hypothetical protein
MPINPITVTRLKTASLLGHSNGDGWGSTDHLLSLTSPSTYYAGGDWASDPANAYYKNIFVATSAQPFSADYGTPTASSVADVAWLEMTIANPQTPGAPHPHASPYNYANNQGACYPRYAYESWPYDGDYTIDANNSPTGDIWFNYDQGTYANGVRHGVEIPLTCLLRAYWGEQVGLIKVAFSSTLVQPQEQGQSASNWLDPFGLRNYTPSDSAYVRSFTNIDEAEWYGYWTPTDQFDWSPASKRLYQMWYDKTEAAAAALPAGTKLDIQVVIPWFGDNDAANVPKVILQSNWENQVRMIVKRIRKDIADNDWSSLDENQIRILWPKIYPTYTGPDDDDSFSSVDFMNEVLDAVAADDEFMAVLPSVGWKNLAQELIDYGTKAPLVIGQASHFGSTGYDQAARDMLEALQGMEPDAFDALDLDECLTLSQVRDRVRTYYSKSRANTDMSDEIVDQHVNAAMYHCLNHCGDNAWWLRRRKQLTITSGASSVMSLPKYVHRMMKIEDTRDPEYPIEFVQIGHGSGGKLQIHVSERATGTYWCQFITMPKELSKADQKLPAPRNIAEWIIVEACRRMAAAANNVPLMGHFAGESAQLQSDSLRSMGQVQRTKKDVMRTQRRRPNFRYGRGRQIWGSDY